MHHKIKQIWQGRAAFGGGRPAARVCDGGFVRAFCARSLEVSLNYAMLTLTCDGLGGVDQGGLRGWRIFRTKQTTAWDWTWGADRTRKRGERGGAPGSWWEWRRGGEGRGRRIKRGCSWKKERGQLRDWQSKQIALALVSVERQDEDRRDSRPLFLGRQSPPRKVV